MAISNSTRTKVLGAVGSSLAAIAWFFVTPYASPVAELNAAARAWALSEASSLLRAQGRISEALPPMRAGLRMAIENADWSNAAIGASNLSEGELLIGAVAAAMTDAEQSVDYADRSSDEFQMLINRATHADALHAAGRRDEAERLFADAEQRQKKMQPTYPLLYSVRGYQHCDLLLSKSEPAAAHERATQTLEWVRPQNWLLDIALGTLSLARTSLASALTTTTSQPPAPTLLADAHALGSAFDQTVEGLCTAGTNDYLPCGLLARAAFRRSVGDWGGAARDLDEVEEIAKPGPMRLFLCDMALERARLAFTRVEAFAPLNGLVNDSPPKPALPDVAEAARLREESTTNLTTARELVAKCGYHRRDEELAELEDVAATRRRFSDLLPRV